MEAKLFVTSGKTSKGSVNLKLPTTIGRSREAGVTVAHPMISRQHCELSESGGLLWLRDLGSLNGTLMGGQKVKESPLRPNDEFTIGPLTFRVEYEFAGDLSAVPAPTLAEEQPQHPTVAADALGMPDFAAVEETPSAAEAEEPIAMAEPAAEEAEDLDPFDAAVMEVTETEPEELPAVAVQAKAWSTSAPEPEVAEELDAKLDDEPVVVFEMEPDDEPIEVAVDEPPAVALAEPAEVEEEVAPSQSGIEAMRQVPDLSFMDDEEPEATIAVEFPLAEEGEFVAVEVVEEDEPEPTPPPGFSPRSPAAPAKKPARPVAVGLPPSKPPAAGPDFAALAESESDDSDSDDAALSDFFKKLP